MTTDIKIVDTATLLAQRAQGEQVEHIPYRLKLGDRLIEGSATKRIVNGEMELIRFTRPIGELMTTPDNLQAIVEKTILDLEQGREQLPTLYEPIYRRHENRDFTLDVRVKTSTGRARAVFVRHLEGEEVLFGDRAFGAEDTVPILTFATGFQWTEDMEEFDLSWEAEWANRAFGEAYNALLNHIHLFPIIDPNHTYPAKNKTAAQTEPGVTAGASYRNDRYTIKKALEHAAQDKNTESNRVRQPTIVLAHPSNRFRVQEALQSAVIEGTQLPAVGQQLTTIILYEGWSETVGQTTYEYPGVPTNKIYLVDPRGGAFQELVKHDLRVDAGGADITRLIKEATVARTRRGAFAVPDNGVEEVTLP